MNAPTGSFHGDSCRRASGGALVTADGFKRANVTLHGASLTPYASSPGVRRQFCGICGTSLAYESTQWAEDIHLSAGAFEKPDQLQPKFHVFWDE